RCPAHTHTLFPYRTLFRSNEQGVIVRPAEPAWPGRTPVTDMKPADIETADMPAHLKQTQVELLDEVGKMLFETELYLEMLEDWVDRKSTRLNSSHVKISYA